MFHAPPPPPAVVRATHALLEAGAPGAVVAVRRGDRTRVVTVGRADRRRAGRPASDARFRQGSVSKTFLSVVVLQLVQEGRLRLDQPLSSLAPGVLPRLDEDAITLRMLLDHTGGVPDPTGALLQDPSRFGDGAVTPAQLVGFAADMPATHAPGSEFSYSNTDYQLLGDIVERVTGRPYQEAVRERVLRPLRLRATVMPSDTTALPAPRLRGLTRFGGEPRDSTAFNATWAGPAGGMVSTAPDLARFAQALMRGRVLSAESLRAMRGDARERRAGYGLGLQRRTTPCGRVVFGHDGGVLGYATRMEATADGRIAVAGSASTDETDAVDAAFDRVVDRAVCR